MRVYLALLIVIAFVSVPPAEASSTCDPDGVQASGSIYRICMPDPGDYNGMLVIWAHGFQHAGTPVEIPTSQLCLNNFCLPTLINSLGFAFATNSYSKTGLAIVQGKQDIVDLVQIFAAQKGAPQKVYLVGASEGGIITALAVEQHPEIFSAGVAACGPVGSFRGQINYLGDARTTFDYFFPGVIPGDPFNPDPALSATWEQFYAMFVEPIVFDPANQAKLDQWAKVAKLPFDAANRLETLKLSVADALHYSVVNMVDASTTLGGLPFDNRTRWYTGSANDLLLNLFVRRVDAAPAALAEMSANYETTGVLQRPLITLHTRQDQQVPYWHEQLYDLKTLASGSWLTRHVNIPIDRFEHCNFTQGEALFSFGVMLLYDLVLQEVSGINTFLDAAELKAFEKRARAVGLPYRRGGSSLRVTLKQ